MARRDRGRLRDRMGETVHLTAAPPAFGARGPGAVGTQPDKPSETRYPAAGGYTDTVHGHGTRGGDQRARTIGQSCDLARLPNADIGTTPLCPGCRHTSVRGLRSRGAISRTRAAD